MRRAGSPISDPKSDYVHRPRSDIGYDFCAVAKAMHQTTVRFGDDLWAALEQEASRLGVSVAQYVRDAALARLSYTAGFHDGHGHAAEMFWPGGGNTELTRRVVSELDSADALRAQGELARERARVARVEAERLRRKHREVTR
jgi:hypothetical protein